MLFKCKLIYKVSLRIATGIMTFQMSNELLPIKLTVSIDINSSQKTKQNNHVCCEGYREIELFIYQRIAPFC